jgi:hypothetical protein
MKFLRKLTEWRRPKLRPFARILGKTVKHSQFCTEISVGACWLITYRELFLRGTEHDWAVQNRRRHRSLCSSDVRFTANSPAIEITPCILQLLAWSLCAGLYIIRLSCTLSWTQCVCVCVCVCARVPAYSHAVKVTLSHHTRGSYDSITLAAFCTRLLWNFKWYSDTRPRHQSGPHFNSLSVKTHIPYF